MWRWRCEKDSVHVQNSFHMAANTSCCSVHIMRQLTLVTQAVPGLYCILRQELTGAGVSLSTNAGSFQGMERTYVDSSGIEKMGQVARQHRQMVR